MGGDSFPAFVNLSMPEQVPEGGKMTIKVTVTGNQSKESTSFERQVTGKNTGLHIIALEFFHDADGKFPTSTNLTEGEPLHFRLRVIGFDRGPGKIHTELAVQTLDEAGKENLSKPLVSVIRQEESKVVEKTGFVYFNGTVVLNRVGKFTLRLTATDRIGDKTSAVEVPLTVTAP